MLKTYSVTLDLENPSSVSTNINVSRADLNVVQFEITVTQDGNALDLTGLLASLVTKSPVGVTVKKDCIMKDSLNGILQVIINSDSSSELGTYLAELKLSDSDGNIAMTNQFSYSARNSLISSETGEAQNAIPSYHQATFNRMSGV